jgi:hypothetical protein
MCTKAKSDSLRNNCDIYDTGSVRGPFKDIYLRCLYHHTAYHWRLRGPFKDLVHTQGLGQENSDHKGHSDREAACL